MSQQLFDVVILGAGISGLVLALETTRAGYKVCVLEDYPNAGGNHISTEINGASFDIGAIFFWSNNLIFDLFPDIKANCVPVRHHISRINPDGVVAAYPYSIRDEFLKMRPTEIGRSALDLLLAKYKNKNIRTADDFIKYYLGAYLADRSGIDHYVRRFYGARASEISSTLAQKRMNWIANNAGLRNTIKGALSFTTPDKSDVAPTCLARPRSGFSEMYKAAVETLRAAGCTVILDAKIERIDHIDDQYRVTREEQEIYSKRITSTFPLAKMGALLGLTDIDPPASTKMLTLFCSFKGKRGFESVILYNFHRSGLWKRLTMHSDYYGRIDDKEYFNVEITFKDNPLSAQSAFEDFADHARGTGLFDGDLELVGSRLTEFAYPLYELDAESKRDAAMNAIQSLGIDLVGRQGAFDYIPAADLAAQEAIKLASRAYPASV